MEMAIDAAMAGERGVPVIFVASDDNGAEEARSFFPGIETVTTKHAMGWNAAVSKHPKRAVTEIFEHVQKAVSNLGNAQPFSFDNPIEFEIRYKRIEAAQAASRGYKGGERIDPYTVRHRLERISDYY